jgi:ribosomal protein S18 acetylase RimI-like enzyme
MVSIDVHSARKGDAATLSRLSRRLVEAGLEPAWTEARIERCRQREDSRVLVARAGAGIVGGALIDFEDEATHLGLLVVDTAWQRRGVGRRLMDAVHDASRAAGLPRITLEVRIGNDSGQRFYAALGYTPAGIIPRYYGPGEDALRFERILPAAELSRW